MLEDATAGRKGPCQNRLTFLNVLAASLLLLLSAAPSAEGAGEAGKGRQGGRVGRIPEGAHPHKDLTFGGRSGRHYPEEERSKRARSALSRRAEAPRRVRTPSMPGTPHRLGSADDVAPATRTEGSTGGAGRAVGGMSRLLRTMKGGIEKTKRRVKTGGGDGGGASGGGKTKGVKVETPPLPLGVRHTGGCLPTRVTRS
jgi:hypothetical protein